MMERKHALLGFILIIGLYIFVSILIGPNYGSKIKVNDKATDFLQNKNHDNLFVESQRLEPNNGYEIVFTHDASHEDANVTTLTQSGYTKGTKYPAWLSAGLLQSDNPISPGLTPPNVLERLFHEAYTTERVFYNRVPKCGSEGVVNLVRKVARVRGFDVARSHEHQEKFLNESEELAMVRYINRLQPPVVYDKHVFFTNFTKFNTNMPVYINVIRDPVERFRSSFYYNKKSCPTDKCRQRTLEECLARKLVDCTFEEPPSTRDKLWMTVPFFCGHHAFCKNHSREAVEQAKKNAAKYYLVIGILEELESFYYVLDRSVPHFFKGIHNFYLQRIKDNSHIRHSTSVKPNTSAEAMEKLKTMFHLEYDFYEFAKDLLNQRLTYINSESFTKKRTTWS